MNFNELEKYIGYLCEAEKILKLAQGICVEFPTSKLKNLICDVQKEYDETLNIMRSLHRAAETPLDRLNGGGYRGSP